ncbi:hypothetical protein AGABI2DRAFT_63594 [Agaricus bisporus var. bisporus H97]|uniref:hypothetical protein n=1 Tax=Agaricus bisporus var. bisporus (strain H97 / ATCC MYA-4626 / FGSC 10389) TaxID=936046 RepID=UPI00029F6FBD|nr:hypothetical protein AGABI2DRAFT_63594 [Agaricus bisporus var. bisporus H97]EKV49694.1 hypothetical protein AGABI2DRAFT_63594 [Agaricus bisporus var. bisporus H97]
MDQGQEKTGRPKRIRKATQQFTSTPTTAQPKKQRATRKAVARTTGKGKEKAADPVAEGASGNQSRTEDTTGEPTKKKARTTKQSAPKEEKRLAQFRSHCPQNVLERAERVRIQRWFFMIERKREGKTFKEEFKVLGSTANVYTVTIDHKPKCSCPDNAIRGNHCKHIMFIFLKVLLVPITSHIWYQKALLTSELETVFAQAPEAPNSVTHPRVLDAYLRATGQKAEASTAASSSKKRIPGEEDDCPICYDTMYGVAEATLTFCEECGNALHKECFEQYQKSARQTGKEITCVWCRSTWGVTTSSKSAGAATQQHGFINLADAVPDLNAHRDTSTYYHGPRRSQHYYGYNQYTS